jgi:hypothetical protein
MSYRSTVLSDYPLAYYPLDDLTTGEVGSWQDILDTFATYADLRDGIPIDYPSYANMSGTTAFDYSGSQNNGQYNGAPEIEILPIVLGNSMATKINNLEIVTFTIGNDYTGNTISANFATAYSSDNDFTLEAWVYPHITTSSEFPLFGDPTNSVGLFYKNGNIVFAHVLQYSLFFNINSHKVSPSNLGLGSHNFVYKVLELFNLSVLVIE